jgi:hypothetical protein
MSKVSHAKNKRRNKHLREFVIGVDMMPNR